MKTKLKLQAITLLAAITCAPFTGRAQLVQPEVLVSFTGPNGAYPQAGLTPGNDGNFYGTTSQGGTLGVGTVFKVTTNGTLTTLVSLNLTNGAYPEAGLTPGDDGNFYGTTSQGGTLGMGTVLKVTTNGTLTRLVSFGNTNGQAPRASLTLGSDGNFYGTTDFGNSNYTGLGTVFKVTLSGGLSSLVSFNGTNGSHPLGALTQGDDGNFYGTTERGGTGDLGTVFKVTTNGMLTILVSFSNTNGRTPRATLTLGKDGAFYGTTFLGGSSGQGTVFRVTTNGTLTTLISFNYTNGAWPEAELTLGNDGNLYGTTISGGSSNRGTVFQVTTNGTLGTLVSCNDFNGQLPTAALTLDKDGSIYGTTQLGGSGDKGTIFRLRPLAPLFISQPQPVSQVVPAGVNVTIDAGVFGRLPLNYQWILGTTDLPGQTNASLTLENVSLSMSGNTYALRVSNTLGTALSSNAILTVVPTIVSTLPASGISATGTVLNSSLTLGPNATLAWFEWGADTNYGQIHGVTNIPGGSGAVSFSSALGGLDGDSVYHYRVAASNSFGIAYGTNRSFQVGIAPSAITLGASGASTDSIALNATVNPGGRQTMVWFKWGTTTNYGNLTPATSVGSGPVSLIYTNPIAGYSLGTRYHCLVVASNSAGLATGGDATFVISEPGAVTEPPTFATGTNAWINGLVTPNSLPTIVWFEWGTNASYGNTAFLGEVGSGSATLAVTYFLSNLDAPVTYHFRLAASNSLGISFGADYLISASLDAYAQTVLVDQPLVYYRFDEASGTTALNFGTVGAAGNGTYGSTVLLGNPSLVPAFGYAPGFNNTNTSVAVPALGTNNSQFTIELWARPRSFGLASPGNPHSLYNSIYTADNWMARVLHTHFVSFSGPNFIRWQLAINGNSPQEVEVGTPGLFRTNSWVYLAATYDSVARRMVTYVNGSPLATNTYSLARPVSLTAAHIGVWITAPHWFDGAIDEFAIYGSALPASRIQAHYLTAIGNPVLFSERETNRLTFTWIGPGFRLQSNPNLSNTSGWTYVVGGSNSPVSVTISNSGDRFFRLRWP